jgi:pyruvate/2-oxoglutarate/acetoin dehydrogenase E1 component
MHTPGLKVVCPSTPYDAKGMLLAAIDDDDPVIFFGTQTIVRLQRVKKGEDVVRDR